MTSVTSKPQARAHGTPSPRVPPEPEPSPTARATAREGAPPSVRHAPRSARGERPQAEWLRQRERGFVWLIRAMLWFATAFGRAPARLVVRGVAFWYACFDRAARRASRGWLRTVRGAPPRFWDVYRHILCFSLVTLDRIFLLRGQCKGIQLKRTGHEHMERLAEERTGAMLIGAHLGSFEVMRTDAASFDMPLNIVGNFKNARMINATLEGIDPDISARVVHIGDDPVGFAAQAQQKLQAGEMLAILADRVGPGDKRVQVQFMGKPAYFPAGPFLLAAIFKCPVYLVFGLYFEPGRYETYCEPFSERIVLPRQDRARALREVVQRFAGRLEHYARKAPDNWFNFYDFWKLDEAPAATARRKKGAAS